MIKHLRQPETYSDILARIAVSTFLFAIMFLSWLGNTHSGIGQFFEIAIDVDYPIISNVANMKVALCFAIALLSRVFTLHNQISNLFRIRKNFDLEKILKPLVRGLGLNSSSNDWRPIEENRHPLMIQIFYPYAGLRKPVIDEQLVRGAMDRWGWFWCLIEGMSVAFLTALTAILLGDLVTGLQILIVGLLLAFPTMYFLNEVEGYADKQVDAILDDHVRESEIRMQVRRFL